jgi:maltose O-acetyltransferase
MVYRNFKEKYNIPDSFWFGGEHIKFYGDGEIEIGENSYIGRYSSIQVSKGAKVKIGNNVAISHYVMIYTENNIADQDFNIMPRITNVGDVEIGNACWIGAKVFIKEGVKIGDNCVIGAHSVVVKDMPANSICSGIPAKVIRQKK